MSSNAAAASTAREARRQSLAAGLSRTRDRIDAAVQACGRVDRPTLVVVTKFFPASDIDLLAELGVREIGESRDQEAADKIARLDPATTVDVHFIGQVQTNKAASVARYAHVVESVDRARLVHALDRAAAVAGRRLDVLLQISLDGSPGRGGVMPAQARPLADLVGECEHLRLRGVMAVAPLGADPRRAFADLREVGHGLQEAHSEATWISAGMSGDLEAAIAEGATHLRVGSAILGSRQSLG